MNGKVLIDGDIVAYRASFSAQDKSEQEAWNVADQLIAHIFDRTIDMPFPSEDDFHVYLTGSNNYRYQIAKSYKANRPKEKPHHLYSVREHIKDRYPTTVSEGEEADDLIAIEATRLGPQTIIASIDKDFKQVPCRHYNFLRETWDDVDEWTGLKFFYSQILSGDAADDIAGLYKVGPKTAQKMLKECETEKDLWETCVKAYDGDTDRVVENARLLWLRRYDGQMWEPPA